MNFGKSIAALRESEDLLGDFRALGAQLGSVDGLLNVSGAASLDLTRFGTAGALKKFLSEYRDGILVPCELPVIYSAYVHTLRNAGRELIELDRLMKRELRLRPFAAASQRVGRTHLNRLRPLRDQRVVQRYVQALDAGQVCAWHTLVYGVTLAVYSVPLRQGLLSYAEQTLGGFCDSASQSLGLIESHDCLSDIFARLPATVSVILGSPSPAQFRTA